MSKAPFRYILFLVFVWVAAGCANIVPPTGGKKDVTPPRLLQVTPPDSQLNARVTKVELRFNEFINVANVATEVQISPLLPFPLNVSVNKRTVIVKIPDSLLQANTTYRISFGNAIQDIHENNPFGGYHYTFSTGSYFDSLRLGGKVINAATGLPDTSAFIILYDAGRSDSAVVREKPLYVSRSGSNGNFSIEGLPNRAFRIYALKDENNNLTFDGQEAIGFVNRTVLPSDSLTDTITLRTFIEEPDSFIAKRPGRKSIGGRKDKNKDKDQPLVYTVKADTANAGKRTFDVTGPLRIALGDDSAILYKERIYLSYDSANITVEASFDAEIDTMEGNNLLLNTEWKENTVYTLRLLKGFIKDSSGTEAMPSRYTFRTQADEDYAKLVVHLPTQYFEKRFVLMINNETDTVYQLPVTDTMVHLNKLKPGTYSMRIIVDENGNGKWDTGNLLEKKQPEWVIPYIEPMNLKPGWENLIDFVQEEKKKPVIGSSPQKRDTNSNK